MFSLSSHFLVYVYVMFVIRHMEKGTWMKQMNEDMKRRGQKEHSKPGDKPGLKQSVFLRLEKVSLS